MSIATPLTCLALLMAATAAAADDAALLQCRTLSDAARRLACYDAIAVGAVAATPPPRQAPAQFGLDKQAARLELDAIDSHVEGRFDGWGPRDRIRFANGQVWQISDDSTGVIDAVNPKVRVRRGAFGAYYLEVEGSNRSPRVRRVQ